MYTKSILIVVLILIGILLFASTTLAVVEHETVRYERPVRTIRGKLTGFGYVVPMLGVQVFDNGQRRNLVATAEPNDKGEFKVKHLPKGAYEVEFGNQGNGGYNILSVLVDVDPKGTNDRLCVDVSLEGGGGGRSSVDKCPPR